MKRRLCLPQPTKVPYFTNCEMEFERRCADGTGSVIECIPAGRLHTQASPQVANQIARELIIGRAKKRTLDCACYDPVGDTQPGRTYFKQFNCVEEVDSSECTQLCFYTSLTVEEMAGGIVDIAEDETFDLLMLDTFCAINGSVFCPFDVNVESIQVFAYSLGYEELFNSINSYCPTFNQTISLAPDQYRLVVRFHFVNSTFQDVYINPDADDFTFEEGVEVNGETYTKICFGESSATSCSFCSTFDGSSLTHSWLNTELGSIGDGNYLYLLDEDTTLRFAFKPYECRFDDPSMLPMPTRYCGAEFYLKVLPLEDFLDDDYSNAVDVFDSSNVPDVCNCELFSFTLEDSGSYVIVFDDLNSGFKCLSTITQIIAESTDRNYLSISEDCLGEEAGYYLICFELANTVCQEEFTALSQSIEVSYEVPYDVTLSVIGIDPDLPDYVIVDYPLHGSLSGTGRNLTYTPDLGYYGPDSFTFEATDGIFTSNLATVTIDVQTIGSFLADYITLQFQFLDGSDLDTRTFTILPEVGTEVGWCQGNEFIGSNAEMWYQWAGDNTGTGFESVLFFVDAIRSAYPAAVIEGQTNAWWYGVRVSGDVTVELKAYQGGVMEYVVGEFRWINVGGVEVGSLTKSANIVRNEADCIVDPDCLTGFTYDLVTNVFEWVDCP